LPGGTAMRRRDEDTPILLRDVDADNASIVARINPRRNRSKLLDFGIAI